MEDMLGQVELQAALELRNGFEKKILGPDRKVWVPAANNFLSKRECWTEKPLFRGQNIRAILENWKDHYKRNFHLEVDLSKVRFPVRYREEADFSRPLLVPQEIKSLNFTYEVLQDKFPCSRCEDDLDAGITENRRDPSFGSYVIWVRDTVEADE